VLFRCLAQLVLAGYKPACNRQPQFSIFPIRSPHESFRCPHTRASGVVVAEGKDGGGWGRRDASSLLVFLEK